MFIKAISPLIIVPSPLDILLVEDNELNIKFAEILLKKQKHKVMVARNGFKAIEALQHNLFDVVLMDIEMPEMDGFEAAERIRRGEAGDANKNVCIIAMTAHALVGIRERCEALGMNGFITKPINTAGLIQVLTKLRQGPD